jgi:hypothetical protein
VCIGRLAHYGDPQVRAHFTLSKKKWHPIWDWSKREVVDAIAKEGLDQKGRAPRLSAVPVAAGAVCGVAAAALKGGTFEALTAFHGRCSDVGLQQ